MSSITHFPYTKNLAKLTFFIDRIGQLLYPYFMGDQSKNHESTSLLSVSDAARYLGVSSSTIRRWERENKILSVRTPGGHRRFSLKDLKSLYKSSSRSGITFS